VKVELEVGQHGEWILRMQGVDCRDALVLVQSSMAEALGALAWETLSPRPPFAIIEKDREGHFSKCIDEKARQEAIERKKKEREFIARSRERRGPSAS